jgi:hypothetical protein
MVARAAATVLVTLVGARALLAFAPSMALWGLNVQRFLEPAAAWLLWGVAAVALLPAAARALGDAARAAGDRLVSGRWTSWGSIAVLAAALLWFLPDRTWITGDFLLRQNVVDSGVVQGVFPQSLPLELLINRTIPRQLGEFSRIEPNVATRAIGALAGAALAVVALGLARTWGFSGSAAIASAGIVFFGGYLAVFTGLGKPASVLCVLAAVVLLAATLLARRGRGGLLLGLAVSMALTTHRSAVVLLPVWLMAVALAFRPDAAAPRERRSGLAWAAALPLVTALAMGPTIWRIVTEFDLAQHVATAEVRSTGWLAALFAPLRLLDLANVMLLLVPLLPLGLLLSFLGTRDEWRATDRRLVLALALSTLPVLVFVRPMQGIFRDLDVYVMPGIAFAILTAHVIGTALENGRLSRALAPAILAIALVPAVQLVLHFHDPRQGLKRVRAFATETPTRPPDELARLWDVVGYRAFRLGEWPTALEASEQSVRYAPHPRAWLMLAIARTYAGDHRGAQAIYVDLARRTPEDPLVWAGLYGASVRLDDRAQTARAFARLRSYAPEGPEIRIIRRHLRHLPEVWPRRDAAGEPMR